MSHWEKIQPLRVESGWTIDINRLFDLEPISENMEWFYGSVLISGHNTDGLCFDVRYEPEGEPDGEFIIDLLQLETKTIEEKLLTSFSTKNRSELIFIIEYFMFNLKAPDKILECQGHTP